ncbi:nicotinamide-nucleotide amidase [Amphibacillus marinus]|uniref:Putative competence-damage inducible protein n=1 Tax=Amphibacillus marinus TaxID=872970 RepID=A0A1H8NNX4_9BACI|nr:competence/damage-inducible protein A [Amphibacillus marinus]SEO31296.1 nicotinamide-nucleotide amidase [Amphibacillus marinus]
MKAINAEIIGVGTELLLGQISNTNAQWLSEQLATKGIGVYYHHVVGDNHKRLLDVFKLAARRSDLVFVTGGLGPTDDDLTRETLAEFVGKPLCQNEQALADLEYFFKRTDRDMTENNLKQTMVIEGAQIIRNHAGTAPGMIVPFQDCHFIIMPGVPNEMKTMMKEQILPSLSEMLKLHDVIVSRMVKFIGIGESQLEMRVKPLIDQQSNPTIAPLATEGEVALRVTAKAHTKLEADELINQTLAQINDYVGEYIYGYDEESISDVIVKWLSEHHKTLAAAESLTGGRFADAFVSVLGAGHVFNGSLVSYTADAKAGALGVQQATIDREGMVSKQCAYEMAKRAKELFNASYGISFTGVAGPDPLEGKEVGTVYICLYTDSDNYIIEQFSFPKSREIVRNRSVKKGLQLIYDKLIRQ